jgi:DNA-directed RNA polymerase
MPQALINSLNVADRISIFLACISTSRGQDHYRHHLIAFPFPLFPPFAFPSLLSIFLLCLRAIICPIDRVFSSKSGPMLAARAAKRKLKHRSASSRQLSIAFNQLHLPWLCPAQVRWMTTALGPQSPPQDAVRHNTPRSGSSREASRSLATAVHYNTGDHIPFLSMAPPSSSSPTPLSFLKPWTPQSPILIHDAIATAAPFLQKQLGIGGDSIELFQNLNACLTIGRYDRAEAILRRLGHLFTSDAPDLIQAHNTYLRSLMDSMVLGRKEASLKRIQRWFEVDMRGQGDRSNLQLVANVANVQSNADTYALMCRAAMLTLSEDARDRTVRRYLWLAEKSGLLGETMASGEFTESEWKLLLELQEDVEMSLDPAAGMAGSSTILEPPQEPSALDLLKAHQPMSKIKSVQQKGLGLKSLTDTLASLDNPDKVPYPQDATAEPAQTDKQWAYLREYQLESDLIETSIARWREEDAHMRKMGIDVALQTKSMEGIMWHWQVALERAVKEELQQVAKVMGDAKSHAGDARLEYGPFLESLKPDKVAAIAIMTTLQYTMTAGMKDDIKDGIKIAPLADKIGIYMEAECTAAQDPIFHKAANARVVASKYRSRVLSRMLLKQCASKSNPDDSALPGSQYDRRSWPSTVKVQLGALLLSKLVETAKVATIVSRNSLGKSQMGSEPAFKHVLEHEKGKIFGKIQAHPELIKKLMKEPTRSNIGMGGHLPMLTEPLPWTGFKKGGYVRYATSFMRTKGGDHIQKMYAEAAIEKGDMDQVFAGINILSKTAWRINKTVLAVMTEAWNTGKAIAEIPAENPEIDFPPEPDASAGVPERLKWRRLIQRLEGERAGFHSQRCYQNLQLEVARAFANEKFYYPHNIDFRGRAYPIPPYLNHMGADNARGLLMFDNGKALGSTGLKWLKVHLANVYGYDKASLSEREQFATDHLEDVYDSANNPLNGNRWWLKAEDPWQCLACCFELRNALESSDPTEYISHIAVHQDGTCNGLQHYAALGGDSLGAAQVNLEPGDRPADIYSGVARLVQADILKEAEEGHPMAKVLNGKISRKVVKQTVMTNVYGVTFVGARAQVQKQLDDIMPNFSECEIENYTLAAYISKKIFKALAAMFQGAHDIQYWLGECADRISTAITPEQIKQLDARRKGRPIPDNPKYKTDALKYTERRLEARISKSAIAEFKSSVIWTTPLKLPVVQPYRASKTREIQTALQGITLREPRPNDPVSKRKQLQAFPPNFIHSLDATHMLLSALKCDEIGLTFAAVHDSFWTHAADVPVMNQVLRDAFVRMHSEDIIGRLAAEFRARYKDSMRLATVKARSPIGKKILAFRRTRTAQRRRMKNAPGNKPVRIGSTMADELHEEWGRQQLLRSENPAERAKGEEMVTPASIFESAGDASEFQLPPKELDEMALGAIPSEAAAEVEAAIDNATGEANSEPSNSKSKKTALKKRHEGKVLVWVPLVFPEVPEKGDFDVSRLKDSTYFFS